MQKMSRVGRIDQLVGILDREPRVWSTHQLIKTMGLTPSPHARGLIYEAFQKGLINGYASKKENNREVFYWHSKKRTFPGQPKLGL